MNLKTTGSASSQTGLPAYADQPQPTSGPQDARIGRIGAVPGIANRQLWGQHPHCGLCDELG
jgi:hypothetical protein